MSFFAAVEGAVVGGIVGAVAAEVAFHSLHKQNGNPPQHAVQCGHQRDGSGNYWGAVAHTEWGEIPCKARGSEAWFTYFGREYATNQFSYIVVANGWHLEKHQGRVPQNALRVGYENNGGGNRYLAVAHTEWGEIPAKAGTGGECWFGYGGKEMVTSAFSWVVGGYAQQQATYYQPAAAPSTYYQPATAQPTVVYQSAPTSYAAPPVSYVQQQQQPIYVQAPAQPSTVIVEEIRAAPATVIIEEERGRGRHHHEHEHHHHEHHREGRW